MRLSLLFFLSILPITACRFSELDRPDKSTLQKACTYLLSQQAPDGGWHSRTHGILKGGASYTAFILWHLLEVKDQGFEVPPEKIKKGLAFLRTHISETGALGLSDPMVVDYPNYATAHALRLFVLFGEEEDTALIQKMTNYLLSQQFTEQRGVFPEDPAYGAWGFGETDLEFGETGHIDLSHTRRVLETLRLAGVRDTMVYANARVFLRLLQKHPDVARSESELRKRKEIPFDGGFYASSVTVSTNKSAIDSLDYFPSYATATADGLLGLYTLEGDVDVPAIQAATRWLKKYSLLDYPQGIPTDDAYQWHRVMFFYHLAVRAEALRKMTPDGIWRKNIQALIQDKQWPDGSFQNPMGGLNKEDDPLLATCLAIIALRT